MKIRINFGRKNYLGILLISGLGFFFSYLVDGVSQVPVLEFLHIKPNDGLTDRYNSFIHKDSKGFVWISSMDGIFRFDGLKLKNYKSSIYKGLADDNIQSNFFEDYKNDLWFTTINAINCYQRQTDSFFSIQLKDQKGNFIGNEYHLFYLEKGHILWLKANGKIYKYNIKTKEQEPIVKTLGYRFAVDTSYEGQVKSIVACPWISNPGIELIKFTKEGKPKKNIVTEFGLPKNNRVEISSSIIESDSVIWLFSNEGLIKYNVQQKLSKVTQLPNLVNDKILDGVVLDSLRFLTIAKNSGLYLFHKEKGFIYRYQQNNSNNSISSNSLLTIYLDNQNYLWLANNFIATLDYGLNTSSAFTNPFKDNLNTVPVVNSISEDNENYTWCSTDKQGIFKLNNQGRIIKHFNYNILNPNKSSIVSVSDLVNDLSGDIWALGNKVIYLIKNDSLIPVLNLQENKAFGLLHVSPKKKLLATDNGVFELKYDSSKQKLIFENNISLSEDALVYVLFKDSNNRIYLPTNNNELLVYQYGQSSNEIEFFKKIETNTDIYSFCEDKKTGNIILGTSNGLIKLDFLNLNKKEWENDNLLFKDIQVYSIHEDNRGFYWMATNLGIWRYHPITFETNHFPIENDQFYLYASFKKANGQIWLGSGNGAITFSPDSLHPYPFEAGLHIKSLEVNQQPFESDKVLDEIKNLKFDYTRNTLAFKVVGVSNYKPDFVKINYQLEGYDEEWQTVENGGTIKFLKLASGKYTLNLYSQNANGIKGVIKKINIEIIPPFWQRRWFQSLCFILAILGFYYLNKYLTNKKLKQQEEKFRKKQEAIKRQQELNEFLQDERNRIAADMHDDLGSGLNSINLLIQSISSKSTAKELPEKLNKIQSKTIHLVENMREIIWAMDGNYDNLSDLVVYIRLYAVDFFDEHELSFDAKFPGEFPLIAVSSKKRRNVFLCFKEAVNNIIKHAEATHVSLTFIYKNKSLEISLKDNGRGIDKDDKNRFGNGLRNMQNRMTQIDGEFIIDTKEGTKLTFKIPISNDNIIKSDTLKITQNGKKSY